METHYSQFQDLIRQFEENNIRYIIIRGFIKLPITPDTDLDIVIHPDDFKNAKLILDKLLIFINKPFQQKIDTQCIYLPYKTDGPNNPRISNGCFRIDIYNNIFFHIRHKYQIPKCLIDLIFNTIIQYKINHKNQDTFSINIPMAEFEILLLICRSIFDKNCRKMADKHVKRINYLFNNVFRTNKRLLIFFNILVTNDKSGRLLMFIDKLVNQNNLPKDLLEIDHVKSFKEPIIFRGELDTKYMKHIGWKNKCNRHYCLTDMEHSPEYLYLEGITDDINSLIEEKHNKIRDNYTITDVEWKPCNVNSTYSKMYSKYSIKKHKNPINLKPKFDKLILQFDSFTKPWTKQESFVLLAPDWRTPYRGVIFNAKQNRYEAYIYKNGECKSLGLYKNPVKAAKVYDKHALEYHNYTAVTNFKNDKRNKITELNKRFSGLFQVRDGAHRLALSKLKGIDKVPINLCYNLCERPSIKFKPLESEYHSFILWKGNKTIYDRIKAILRNMYFISCVKDININIEDKSKERIEFVNAIYRSERKFYGLDKNGDISIKDPRITTKFRDIKILIIYDQLPDYHDLVKQGKRIPVNERIHGIKLKLRKKWSYEDIHSSDNCTEHDRHIRNRKIYW